MEAVSPAFYDFHKSAVRRKPEHMDDLSFYTAMMQCQRPYVAVVNEKGEFLEAYERQAVVEAHDGRNERFHIVANRRQTPGSARSVVLTSALSRTGLAVRPFSFLLAIVDCPAGRQLPTIAAQPGLRVHDGPWGPQGRRGGGPLAAVPAASQGPRVHARGAVMAR